MTADYPNFCSITETTATWEDGCASAVCPFLRICDPQSKSCHNPPRETMPDLARYLTVYTFLSASDERRVSRQALNLISTEVRQTSGTTGPPVLLGTPRLRRQKES